MTEKCKFEDLFGYTVPEAEKIQNTNNLLNSLSIRFSDSIQTLCDKSGLNEDVISDEVFLSKKSLYKWRNDEDNVMAVKLESVVKFCFGLCLPPAICEYLWRNLGHIYRVNQVEQAYKEISKYYYVEDIEEINEYLEEHGLKLWKDRNA